MSMEWLLVIGGALITFLLYRKFLGTRYKIKIKGKNKLEETIDFFANSWHGGAILKAQTGGILGEYMLLTYTWDDHIPFICNILYVDTEVGKKRFSAACSVAEELKTESTIPKNYRGAPKALTIKSAEIEKVKQIIIKFFFTNKKDEEKWIKIKITGVSKEQSLSDKRFQRRLNKL